MIYVEGIQLTMMHLRLFRTDQGVHALKSALTVDLEFKVEPPTRSMHYFLNRFLDKADLPIRFDFLLIIFE